jgi:hypothetical protein
MGKSKLRALRYEYNNKYFKPEFKDDVALPLMTTPAFNYSDYRKKNETRFFNTECYTILAKWMLEVGLELELEASIICIAFEYLKVVLCKPTFTQSNIQLFGAACLSLAIRTRKELKQSASLISNHLGNIYQERQILQAERQIREAADLSKIISTPDALFKITTAYTAKSMCELMILISLLFDDFLQYHPASIAIAAYMLTLIRSTPITVIWNDIKSLQRQDEANMTQIVEYVWQLWNKMTNDDDIKRIITNYFINVYDEPTDVQKKNIVASLFDNKD